MAIAKKDPVAKHADGKLGVVEWAGVASLSVGIAALGYFIAHNFVFNECFDQNGCGGELYMTSSDYGALAGIFVLTLAVERGLEPFSRFFGPSATTQKNERDKALADDDVQAAANAQAGVDRARQISVLVGWGVASGVAFVLCSALHVFLLTAIAKEGSPPPTPWADLLITGLVVGAGTKPVHDLVARIQKKKDDAEDPKETKAGTGP